MAELSTEIPKRAVFKASEVCEIAGLQPFVLRSWESEFPDLGTARLPGVARTYTRHDVERVLQIKHLVFGEGLTLGGARRRLEEERAKASPDVERSDEEPPAFGLDQQARERLIRVRDGLRSILDLLSARAEVADAPATEFELTGSVGRTAPVARVRARNASEGTKRRRVESAAPASS